MNKTKNLKVGDFVAFYEYSNSPRYGEIIAIEKDEKTSWVVVESLSWKLDVFGRIIGFVTNHLEVGCAGYNSLRVITNMDEFKT